MSAKAISDWERERNLALNGDVDPSQQVSAEDFDGLVAEHGFIGVNFADREAFLKDNGYKLTRANLLDSSLSATAPVDGEPEGEQ